MSSSVSGVQPEACSSLDQGGHHNFQQQSILNTLTTNAPYSPASQKLSIALQAELEAMSNAGKKKTVHSSEDEDSSDDSSTTIPKVTSPKSNNAFSNFVHYNPNSAQASTTRKIASPKSRKTSPKSQVAKPVASSEQNNIGFVNKEWVFDQDGGSFNPNLYGDATKQILAEYPKHRWDAFKTKGWPKKEEQALIAPLLVGTGQSMTSPPESPGKRRRSTNYNITQSAAAAPMASPSKRQKTLTPRRRKDSVATTSSELNLFGQTANLLAHLMGSSPASHASAPSETSSKTSASHINGYGNASRLPEQKRAYRINPNGSASLSPEQRQSFHMHLGGNTSVSPLAARSRSSELDLSGATTNLWSLIVESSSVSSPHTASEINSNIPSPRINFDGNVSFSLEQQRSSRMGLDGNASLSPEETQSSSLKRGSNILTTPTQKSRKSRRASSAKQPLQVARAGVARGRVTKNSPASVYNIPRNLPGAANLFSSLVVAEPKIQPKPEKLAAPEPVTPAKASLQLARVQADVSGNLTQVINDLEQKVSALKALTPAATSLQLASAQVDISGTLASIINDLELKIAGLKALNPAATSPRFVNTRADISGDLPEFNNDVEVEGASLSGLTPTTTSSKLATFQSHVSGTPFHVNDVADFIDDSSLFGETFAPVNVSPRLAITEAHIPEPPIQDAIHTHISDGLNANFDFGNFFPDLSPNAPKQVHPSTSCCLEFPEIFTTPEFPFPSYLEATQIRMAGEANTLHEGFITTCSNTQIHATNNLGSGNICDRCAHAVQRFLDHKYSELGAKVALPLCEACGDKEIEARQSMGTLWTKPGLAIQECGCSATFWKDTKVLEGRKFCGTCRVNDLEVAHPLFAAEIQKRMKVVYKNGVPSAQMHCACGNPVDQEKVDNVHQCLWCGGLERRNFLGKTLAEAMEEWGEDVAVAHEPEGAYGSTYVDPKWLDLNQS